MVAAIATQCHNMDYFLLELLCDTKTLRLTNDLCDAKLSGEPTRIAALQNLKNTCYVHYAPLPLTHVSLFGYQFDF